MCMYVYMYLTRRVLIISNKMFIEINTAFWPTVLHIKRASVELSLLLLQCVYIEIMENRVYFYYYNRLPYWPNAYNQFSPKTKISLLKMYYLAHINIWDDALIQISSQKRLYLWLNYIYICRCIKRKNDSCLNS